MHGIYQYQFIILQTFFYPCYFFQFWFFDIRFYSTYGTSGLQLWYLVLVCLIVFRSVFLKTSICPFSFTSIFICCLNPSLNCLLFSKNCLEFFLYFCYFNLHIKSLFSSYNFVGLLSPVFIANFIFFRWRLYILFLSSFRLLIVSQHIEPSFSFLFWGISDGLLSHCLLLFVLFGSIDYVYPILYSALNCFFNSFQISFS